MTLADKRNRTILCDNKFENCLFQVRAVVFKSITPVLDADPGYRYNRILEQLVEPDRSISFRVPWKDDQGRVQVNTGHRVEFNNVLGPL
jgi:glutamate dehydrogenase (NADP+)